jgi:purine nucleosidase
MAVKVLLNTDIGGDIDDAVCLAYLLANPECELLGITTVTSGAVERAKLASVLCKIANKDIPIYPGSENPLLIPQLQTKVDQAFALKNWKHQKNYSSGEAVEFLRSTIRKHPGKVILLTIGPLTNVAVLFSVDPEIPSLLKGLYSMCGHYLRKDRKVSRVEWNAMLDYHATAMVYNSKVKIHRSYGLDVTTKLTMNPDEFKQRFSEYVLLKPVVDFSKAWFKNWPLVTFHDPLAAVAIFDKKVCEYQKGLVEVELEKKKERGLTKWNPDQKGKHEIAVKVNPERFFTEYFKVFN